MTGNLYVVATPIGNLQDISLRAIETLNQVDFIAAEDTRITKRLLNKYEISKKTFSFHIKNENFKVKSIIRLLLDFHNNNHANTKVRIETLKVLEKMTFVKIETLETLEKISNKLDKKD